MSNELKNNFEDLIRNKLEDYETPVSPKSWDTVEKSLGGKNKGKYYFAASALVAAAVALLFITLNKSENINTNPTNTDNPNPIVDTYKKENKENIEPEIKTAQPYKENESSHPQQIANNEPKENTVSAKKITGSITNKQEKTVQQEPGLFVETFKSTVLAFPTIKNDIQVNLQASPSLAELRTLPETKATDDFLIENDFRSTEPQQVNNRNWVASLGFGAANYQDANRGNTELMASPVLTLDKYGEYVKNVYRDNISVPDNAEPEHGLPLSFKASVKKQLTPRWGIESGISYTYLPTKFKWNKGESKQQLHYIGIPVNIMYHIILKPNWNVYVSAGGMVEKGIYGAAKQDGKTTKITMDGLQWSVNGSVGITYNLTHNLGLFFEPQFGYFFDNKQPESIRTEWPISVGLGAGLRFKF